MIHKAISNTRETEIDLNEMVLNINTSCWLLLTNSTDSCNESHWFLTVAYPVVIDSQQHFKMRKISKNEGRLLSKDMQVNTFWLHTLAELKWQFFRAERQINDRRRPACDESKSTALCRHLVVSKGVEALHIAL